MILTSETILVTGGAGFIGSQVVDAFIASGNHAFVVDNLLVGKWENIHLSPSEGLAPTAASFRAQR
jgi:nucleoside-diphosphate-sugar epimerase